MVNLIKQVNKSIIGLMRNFLLIGILLFVFGVVVMVDSSTFALRLVVSAFLILVSISFLHAAWKFWTIKREIDKFN